MRGLPVLERIAARVEVAPDSRCWIWTGYVHPTGYGHINLKGKVWRVHRLTYTLLVGPIPGELETDHLCGVRACVNPGHLELVTHLENMRRRSVRQTHCKWGHERSEGNVYRHKTGRVVCKACHRGWMAAYQARIRQAAS